MDNAIEDLKNAVDMREYMERFMPDKFEGCKHVNNGDVYICCPFHDEKTPSMLIHKERYKCFGCGESGDIIDMVMKTKNESFKEACLEIADNVGFKLHFEPPNPDYEAFKAEKLKLCRKYYANLQKNPNALNYLMNERRISEDMIQKFVLGLTAPDEYKYRQDVGSISNRIVFPIFEDVRKPSIIGMAYRRLIEDSSPKYINDPNQTGANGQNPKVAGVFTKGNVMYGMYQALPAIKEQGYAIVVEGYFDVISMHQSGICNTVGTMGALMTNEQAEWLSKKTRRVMLMLDSDQAGMNGARHAAKLLLARGMDVYICTLKCHDPDELCKSENFNGASVMSKRGEVRPAINVFVDDIVRGYEDMVTKERTKAIQMSKEYEEYITLQGQKDVFNRLLLKRLDML